MLLLLREKVEEREERTKSRGFEGQTRTGGTCTSLEVGNRRKVSGASGGRTYIVARQEPSRPGALAEQPRTVPSVVLRHSGKYPSPHTSPALKFTRVCLLHGTCLVSGMEPPAIANLCHDGIGALACHITARYAREGRIPHGYTHRGHPALSRTNLFAHMMPRVPAGVSFFHSL